MRIIKTDLFIKSDLFIFFICSFRYDIIYERLRFAALSHGEGGRRASCDRHERVYDQTTKTTERALRMLLTSVLTGSYKHQRVWIRGTLDMFVGVVGMY